tara:strand:+ start:6214 stop:7269 length:1056 start_codon:yes stop_codon:yes gene_type:complete
MKKTEKTEKKNKTGKSKVKYSCESCYYITSNKTDYFRHLKTKKHLKQISRKQKTKISFLKTEKTKKNANTKLEICKCGKKFKTRGGLWKHQKKCNIEIKDIKKNVSKIVSNVSKNVSNVSAPSKTEPKLSVDEELKHLQLQKAKLEVAKLQKEIENLDKPQTSTNSLTNELVETIGKIAGNNNCNNTNNISINMYLNEQCKNAMNLEDFVRNITVSLKDLDYSKQNGYAKGITNIFMKQLADLEPTERPIHCSDKKRLQFYVKDADKWEKDKDNKKLTSSIKSVGMEQVKKMSEWEKEHPDYMNNPDELEEWQKMLENVSGGINKDEMHKNVQKIKKQLGKVVDIKEELNK